MPTAPPLTGHLVLFDVIGMPPPIHSHDRQLSSQLLDVPTRLLLTWICPLHAIWVCIVFAYTEALLIPDTSVHLQIVTPYSGVGDDGVRGDEREEEHGEQSRH